MAFNRKIELSVNEVIGSKRTETLVSDLDIEFNIVRSISFAENTSEFMIYNAKENTRKDILKKGNNLAFKAGYEDETIGTIFIGNITKSSSVQVGPDWLTTILSSSMQSDKKAIEEITISLSFAPGILLSQVLTEIGAALGLAVLGQENAQIPLLNGYTYVGAARGALNYCKNILESNGTSLYIDNTEIIIYNVDSRDSRFVTTFLSHESGLLTVQELVEENPQEVTQTNPKRIEFSSIIIPGLQPNGLVTLKGSAQDGTYLIEKLTFNGDNFGGDFSCMGEAVA